MKHLSALNSQPWAPEQVRSDPVLFLLFDFGGTLDAEGIPWKDRFFRLCREEGVEVSREVFDPAFYAANDALVGRLPATLGLRETVERLAGGLAGGLGLADGSVAGRLAARFHAQASERLAESARLLERLSRRYRLGIVSNFYGNLAAVCAEAGMAPSLSVTVDSAVVGYTKPDRRIFEAALTPLRAHAGETVFVGDSAPRDMAGAREAGMRHVWLVSREANGAARPCCPGDAMIRRLAEIEEILP